MNGRGARPRQDPPIEHALPCSLEEIYKGTTKRMKISRSVMDAGGRMQRVEEALSVEVKPGWKKGTKVTFPKKGELLSCRRADESGKSMVMSCFACSGQ